MTRAIARRAGRASVEYGMIVNVARWVAAGSASQSDGTAMRDRQLFVNFQTWRAALPGRQSRQAKVIVWAHSLHVAKDATRAPSFAHVRNFGSLIRAAYGDRAVAVGLTALSGGYLAGRTVRPLPPAPTGALEARVFAGRGAATVVLDRDALARLGTVPAAFFNHEYYAADWSTVFDLAVVFLEEWPQRSTRQGYR